MFALTRRVNESIVIPVHSITIHVTQINDRVTLAFDAPEDVRILRGEVYDPSKPVEPRPKPLKVPAPAGVFVAVALVRDEYNVVMPLACVNRARAIKLAAKRFNVSSMSVGADDEDPTSVATGIGHIRPDNMGGYSECYVTVHHLPVE